MRENAAMPRQGSHGRIGAANARAADGQEQIADAILERIGDGCCIAAGRLAASHGGAGRAGAFGDQRSGHGHAAGGRGNIDQAQPRTPHPQVIQRSDSRDQ